MALGHNIVPFISTRCGGAVHMIDVGMSYAYEGRPAAWRCLLDEASGSAQVSALYMAGDEAPPDLCTACAGVLGALRASVAGDPPLRGSDPHGDCSNYCSATTAPMAMLKGGAAKSSGAKGGGANKEGNAIGRGLASLFGSFGGPVKTTESDPLGNHVKTEF